MSNTKKTAIILGATGLTGGILLQKLLNDDRYGSVKLFSRNSTSIDHSKITEFIVDLLRLEESGADFTGDEVFVCIGTTKKKTPDESKYYQIDFGIPVAAAKLCALNGIDSYAVISSIGASAKSRGFYLRTKGEMEEAVLASGIKRCYVLRPSLIVGDRKELRFIEKLSAGLMWFFNLFMIGGWRKYRSIKASCIAEAMIRLVNDGAESGVVESDEIQEMANRKDTN